MRIKSAVIGCGTIGADERIYSKTVRPGTHAVTYLQNKNVDLVALVDTDLGKLRKVAKYFPSAKIFTNSRKMFKEVKSDIVSIATPTKYHKTNVILATQFGAKAILCEKPIAYSAADGKLMIQECKKNKTQLFINHQRHFDPLINKWNEKVKKGLLGRIYQGDVYYSNGFFNNATHIIDLLRMFLGEPEFVLGSYNKLTSSKIGDVSIDGNIKFKNGAFVSLHSLAKNMDYFDVRLAGDKGLLTLHDLGSKIEFRKKIRSPNFKGYFEYSNKHVSEGKVRSMMPAVINHLVNYVIRSIEPISTGEDGLRVLEILTAFKYSADHGSRKISV